jgi:hypothetical protein
MLLFALPFKPYMISLFTTTSFSKTDLFLTGDGSSSKTLVSIIKKMLKQHQRETDVVYTVQTNPTSQEEDDDHEGFHVEWKMTPSSLTTSPSSSPTKHEPPRASAPHNTMDLLDLHHLIRQKHDPSL